MLIRNWVIYASVPELPVYSLISNSESAVYLHDLAGHVSGFG
jgi:hypothetical protein